MHSDGLHIIEKLTVEIDVPRADDGFRIKDNVAAFVDRYVIPAIERYLSDLESDVPPGRIVRIDRVQIDLTTGSGGLEDARGISASVAMELEEALLRSLVDIRREQRYESANPSTVAGKKPQVTTLEPSGRLTEAFVYFIEHGTRPWWISRAEELDALLSGEALRDWKPAACKQLADAVLQRLRAPGVRRRLVRQLADDVITKILFPTGEHGTTPARQARELELFLRMLETEARFPASVGTREQVWDLLFHLLPGVPDRQTMSPESLVAAMERKLPADYAAIRSDRLVLLVRSFLKLAQVFSGETFSPAEIKAQAAAFAAGKIAERSESPRENRERPAESANAAPRRQDAAALEKSYPLQPGGGDKTRSEREGIYVDNAGLVLAHPFLKHLFLNTGQLEDGRFADPVLAVHMLHYLATGKEQAYEHEMVFEKYLVGLPPEESIPRAVPLGRVIRDEIAALLDALKQNWPEMAHSSHNAIRETFLQRPGKLVLEEPHPRLVVERKTLDILMDRLGWAISIVRFPWKEEILYVEW